jgi:hypothetical protein
MWQMLILALYRYLGEWGNLGEFMKLFGYCSDLPEFAERAFSITPPPRIRNRRGNCNLDDQARRAAEFGEIWKGEIEADAGLEQVPKHKRVLFHTH